jgi:hypothetical protein
MGVTYVSTGIATTLTERKVASVRTQYDIELHLISSHMTQVTRLAEGSELMRSLHERTPQPLTSSTYQAIRSFFVPPFAIVWCTPAGVHRTKPRSTDTDQSVNRLETACVATQRDQICQADQQGSTKPPPHESSLPPRA